MKLAEQLKSGLDTLGINCNKEQIDQAIAFQALVSRWNKVTNLTSITEPEKMISLHLLDACSVQPFVTGSHIIDVGSGAGIPGIPLALINPDKDFILLDANGKKTRFMTQVQIELGLKNVEVVHSRVEDYEGSFGHVLSRAFRSLADFIETCSHLVGQTGNMLAMKGPDHTMELSSLETSGFRADVHQLNVPGIDAERFLIELKRRHVSPPAGSEAGISR